MVSGFAGSFQPARCFRKGILRADRQPEFTQIDVEASFVTQDDVIDVAEEMMRPLWQEGGSLFPAGRVRRMTYADAMERYGVDRPDLRYGLEIADVTEAFRAVEFPFTATAIAAGGRVRGIRIPGGASLSRKQLDEIDAVGKSAGVRGVLRVKNVNGVVAKAGGKGPGGEAAAPPLSSGW